MAAVAVRVRHPTPNISTAFLYRFDPHVRYKEVIANPSFIDWMEMPQEVSCALCGRHSV